LESQEDRKGTLFNLHAILPRNSVNGPGERYVLVTQGCSKACPGCINADARVKEERILLSVNDIFGNIAGDSAIEGVSFTGGEPLEQMDALLELCRRIKEETGLSIVVYSGYYIDEIKALDGGNEILGLIDILVAGPFMREMLTPDSIAGSANQEIFFLTGRYSPTDLDCRGKLEIYIHPDGKITATGIVPESFTEIAS
jgi:anaerobic ribonucleoside-triphosphate reductase activating protein